MVDKRQHLRVPFSGKAKLTTADCEPLEVTISNMSLAGLLFHSSQVYDLGQQVTIQISGTFQEKHFKETVRGRVVTAHRGPAGNSFALRFLCHLNEERVPSLCGWIESHEGKPIPSFLRNSASSSIE